MNGKIVLPGERLSTSEELLPGDGTYEEEGVIKASRVGRYIVNKESKKAEVKPITSIPVEVKKGDIVIAKVDMVKSSMIVLDIIHVVGKNRAISGDKLGTLHVSEISKGYVKDPSTEFGVGDYIKAKVTQVKPSIQLDTKDADLGSIRSLCKKCRQPLIKKGNILQCKKCGFKQKRRITNDYDNIDLKKL